MKVLVRLVLIVIVVAAAGGGLWLAMTEPDPPRRDMEKVIPNDRFAL